MSATDRISKSEETGITREDMMDSRRGKNVVKMTIGLGGTGASILGNKRNTDADVLGLVEAVLEAEKHILDPDVITLKLGEGFTLDTLLAYHAHNSKFAGVAKLLANASNSLAEGMGGWPITGNMAFEALGKAWREWLKKITTAIFNLAESPEKIVVRLVGSLSGGTCSGSMHATALALEKGLLKAFPMAKIQIEIVVVGAETYQGLLDQIEWNNAVGFAGMLGYVLDNKKDPRVSRRILALELNNYGDRGTLRRDELVMALSGILTGAIDKIGSEGNNKGSSLGNPYARGAFMRVGYVRMPRHSDLRQASIAQLIPVVTGLIGENGVSANLDVTPFVTEPELTDAFVPANKDGLLELVRKDGSTKPSDWLTTFAKSQYAWSKSSTTIAEGSNAPVEMANVIKVIQPKTGADYLAQLSFRRTIVAKLKTQMATLKQEQEEHRVNLSQTLAAIQETLQAVWSNDRLAWIKKLASPLDRDDMAQNLDAQMTEYMRIEYEIERREAYVVEIQAVIDEFERAITELKVYVKNVLQWLEEDKSDQSQDATDGMFTHTVSMELVGQLIAFRLADKRAEFCRACDSALHELSPRGLGAIYGTTDLTVANLVRLIAQDPPDASITPSVGRMPLGDDKRSVKAIPPVDKGFFDQLDAEVKAKNHPFTLVMMGALQQENVGVVSVDYCFGEGMERFMTPKLLEDYDGAIESGNFQACYLPGTATLNALARSDQKLQRLVAGQKEEARAAAKGHTASRTSKKVN